MAGHTNWRKLRDELRAKPGGEEAIARARQESLEELRLYELRHAVSQVELAGADGGSGLPPPMGGGDPPCHGIELA